MSKRAINLLYLICTVFLIFVLINVVLSHLLQSKTIYVRQSHQKVSGPSPIGNLLSAYFYYISIDRDASVLQRFNNTFSKVYDDDLLNFYAGLNWDLNLNINWFTSEPCLAWNQLHEDGSRKENFSQYWQQMRPLIKQVYAENLPEVKVHKPVMHFRCSDSPFNKNQWYHITKAESINWFAEQIAERGFNEAILLNCNAHGRLDQGGCAKYAEFYTQIFAAHNIHVEQQCNSIIHDFALMVKTPLLVSLNASSFSFMAGVAKDPNDYISANMGIETSGKYNLQTEADWILDPYPPLLHKNVEDYNKAEDVIPLLY